MMHSKYSGRAVSLVGFVPLLFLSSVMTGQRPQENVVPLKNWASPLYWQPSNAEMAEMAERETAGDVTPKLVFSASQVSPSALTFIAVTPCRLVDTRGVPAGFNGLTPFSGPSLAPSTSVNFPVQSAAEATADTTPTPCGTIPSIAQAYSFNITVIPKTAGGIGFVTMWPTGSPQPGVSTLNDGEGVILANAAIVPAGTPSGGVSVFNSGPATTDVIIDMNGFYAAPSDLSQDTAVGAGALVNNTTGTFNTAVGTSALQGNSIGSSNVAIGVGALQDNTNGSNNTASGHDALQFNTNGFFNTANGESALYSNTQGNANTAVGAYSLEFNGTGSSNTAGGYHALSGSFTGSQNTAYGAQALEQVTSGNNNIGIGSLAGSKISGANSDNIYVGSPGSENDSGTIRIGNAASFPGCGCSPQTSFFVVGVNNVNLGGDTNAVGVLIDTVTGQLGVTSSSRRYKEDIEDMGQASHDLMRLRPVTFRYKKPFTDGSKPIQYGLIAEEVDEVYPDLVAHSADGQIETVKYQVLDSMLLNEVQKQHQLVEQQAETIRLLEKRLAALEAK